MPRAALAAAIAAALAGGCGGSDDEGPASGAPSSSASGTSLTWAVGDRIERLDPLFARTDAEQLVSRQVHEPLVASLSGPFEDPRRRPGLALRVRPSSDRSVWRVGLRSGVRFQDGSPLDARAVVENAERWQAVPELSGMPPPPELFVFAPKPDEVAFRLARPDPTFDRGLADARLGIVSPRALRRAAAGELRPAQASESGTGPFEIRERSKRYVLMAPNAAWWGTPIALGPGIEQLEFVYEPAEAARVEMLREGEAELAGGLSEAAEGAVARDPLLSVIAPSVGAERSVRGIPQWTPVPSLNGVWLTRIDAS